MREASWMSSVRLLQFTNQRPSPLGALFYCRTHLRFISVEDQGTEKIVLIQLAFTTTESFTSPSCPHETIKQKQKATLRKEDTGVSGAQI